MLGKSSLSIFWSVLLVFAEQTLSLSSIGLTPLNISAILQELSVKCNVPGNIFCLWNKEIGRKGQLVLQ